MNRRKAFALFASSMLVGGLKSAEGSGQDADGDHTAWVGRVLLRMETVKPGMTRADVYGPFTTQGGLSTPLQQSYVSRDCRYFKVDVTFRAVGRPERDSDGRVTGTEDARDQIVTISRPYVEFGITD